MGLLSEMEGMASPIYKINLDKSKFGTNLEAGPITYFFLKNRRSWRTRGRDEKLIF